MTINVLIVAKTGWIFGICDFVTEVKVDFISCDVNALHAYWSTPTTLRNEVSEIKEEIFW